MRPTMLLMVLASAGLLSARAIGAQAPDASGSPGSTLPPAAAHSDLQAVSPPRGGSLEQERTPGVGPRIHEPIFLEPAATTSEHTRLGLSSWIAPGAPFDHQENPGGVAVGFTIAWPPPARDVPSSGPSAWRGSAAR